MLTLTLTLPLTSVPRVGLQLTAGHSHGTHEDELHSVLLPPHLVRIRGRVRGRVGVGVGIGVGVGVGVGDGVGVRVRDRVRVKGSG